MTVLSRHSVSACCALLFNSTHFSCGNCPAGVKYTKRMPSKCHNLNRSRQVVKYLNGWNVAELKRKVVLLKKSKKRNWAWRVEYFWVSSLAPLHDCAWQYCTCDWTKLLIRGIFCRNLVRRKWCRLHEISALCFVFFSSFKPS